MPTYRDYIADIKKRVREATPEQVEDLIRSGDVQLGDVREKDEWNAGLRARRRELRGRRLRKEAAVARALEGLEHGDLALEAKDRSMNDGDAMFDRRVVQEIPGGEVVCAVDHDVVALDDAIDVRRGQAFLVADDLDVGIQGLERLLRRGDLRLADAIGVVKDLPLQVGEVDHIGVDDAKRTDAGRGEVIRRRRSEATRSDEEHFAVQKLLLTRLADFRDKKVTRVPLRLIRREARGRRPRLAGILPAVEAAGHRDHVLIAELLQRVRGHR